MEPRDLSRSAVDLAAIGASGIILTAGAVVALALRIHWSIR